jgi:hypothetical protein
VLPECRTATWFQIFDSVPDRLTMRCRSEKFRVVVRSVVSRHCACLLTLFWRPHYSGQIKRILQTNAVHDWVFVSYEYSRKDPEMPLDFVLLKISTIQDQLHQNYINRHGSAKNVDSLLLRFPMDSVVSSEHVDDVATGPTRTSNRVKKHSTRNFGPSWVNGLDSGERV